MRTVAQPKASPRSGMSLIELLIVLALMAAIASVALTTLDGMGDRTRMDTTRDRLDMIEEAIVGDGLSAGRFLNDMGRLPVDTTDWSEHDGAVGLSELWTPGIPDDNRDDDEFAYDVLALTFQSDVTGDSDWFYPDTGVEVNLGCGWCGPYLRVHGEGLYDGFGNPFDWRTAQDILDDDWYVHPALPGPSILQVASLGRDGALGSDSEGDWASADESREFPDAALLVTLHLRILVRDDSPAGGPTWLPPTSLGEDDAEATDWNWQDNTTYLRGDVVRAGGTLSYPGDDADKDDLFVCVSAVDAVAGGQTEGDGLTNSGGSAPAWDREGLVSDGELHWRWLSHYAKMNRMRVTVFSPYAAEAVLEGELGAEIRRTTAVWDDDAADTKIDQTENRNEAELTAAAPAVDVSWDGMGNVTFDNLTPGCRKLLAYGALVFYHDDNTDTATNAHTSGLQTIELKPGTNHITVYLNEPLRQSTE